MRKPCQNEDMGIDQYDNGKKNTRGEQLKPLNTEKIPARKTAVSLQEQENKRRAPKITAAGRGVIAEKILQLAFENDIKVRKDSDLAEMLAQIELDSPIPTEAFTAVAEILSYVYRANGEADPFDAVLKGFDKDDE
ncbi:MAG: EscU/YscU/HrcU family type III secretion system export apparatus switch protein [Alphaproteobacteria bacterium]